MSSSCGWEESWWRITEDLFWFRRRKLNSFSSFCFEYKNELKSVDSVIKKWNVFVDVKTSSADKTGLSRGQAAVIHIYVVRLLWVCDPQCLCLLDVKHKGAFCTGRVDYLLLLCQTWSVSGVHSEPCRLRTSVFSSHSCRWCVCVHRKQKGGQNAALMDPCP